MNKTLLNQIIDDLKLLQISTVLLEYAGLSNSIKFDRQKKLRVKYASLILNKAVK